MTKVAWLTGASTGIGRALALRLARAGWVVAASARNLQELEKVAAAAGDLTGKIIPFPLDVQDSAAVKQTVAAIQQTCGAIDLAFLNAGTHLPGTVRDFNVADYRTLYNVNVMGVVECLGAVLPNFIARRQGHVAVVASVAGYGGLPLAAAYGGTKAALINMCEAWKVELEPYNIKLSLICPGFVKTPLTDLNKFKMPFLITADDAAERIFKRLFTREFEISFPRRFTFIMKALRLLPYSIYFALMRGGVGALPPENAGKDIKYRRRCCWRFGDTVG